jgi:hypothetical protein
MSPLSNRVPRSDKVLFLFYDFETTQNTKRTNTSFENVPNLLCVHQFCAVCEEDDDVEVDSRRCGKRKHSFCTDPTDDLIPYIFKSRPWDDRIVTIAHNTKAFDILFLMNSLVRMKLLPKLLTMNCRKIMCLRVENVKLLDSLNYLAIPLRKFPEAFNLTAEKSCYPHLLNTDKNMNYVSPTTEISHYDVDQMHESERKEIQSCSETTARSEVFANRRLLERYWKTHVAVLRETCRTFRRHVL